MRTKTRMIVFTVTAIALVLVVVTALFAGHYNRVKRLCDEIKVGEEIHTNIGNAFSAPRALHPIFTILQMEGVQVPLITACRYENIQAVKALLENGADPNLFVAKGHFTAIEATLASVPCNEKNRYEILKLLINNGADVNISSNDDDPPIFMTIRDTGYSEDELRLMMDHGAIGIREDGFSLLHSAAYRSQLNLAKVLIYDYHYDVNQTTYDGNTPLICLLRSHEHTASEKDLLLFAQMLIDNGADIYITNNDGKTAYDYAIENDYIEIAHMLASK